MNNRGFTLIEVMVALAIMSIITALTFPAFFDLLNVSKGETSSNEAHIDKIVGLELMRLDLEHANYGIGTNVSTPSITWDATNKILQLNSTINNTNQATIGWMLYDCTNSNRSLGITSGNLIKDKRQDSSNTCFSLLDSNRQYVATETTTGSCPTGQNVYTAFPIARNQTGTPCASTPYTSVQYKLSSGTNTLSDCAIGTHNLLRQVGAGTGEPILNCIADFAVTFDLDTNNDDVIDTPSSNTAPSSVSDVLNQVKNIHMYALMQTGRKDDTLNSNENLSIEGGGTLSKVGITDASNYRWKVVHISGKPMGW